MHSIIGLTGAMTNSPSFVADARLISTCSSPWSNIAASQSRQSRCMKDRQSTKHRQLEWGSGQQPSGWSCLEPFLPWMQMPTLSPPAAPRGEDTNSTANYAEQMHEGKNIPECRCQTHLHLQHPTVKHSCKQSRCMKNRRSTQCLLHLTGAMG